MFYRDAVCWVFEWPISSLINSLPTETVTTCTLTVCSPCCFPMAPFLSITVHMHYGISITENIILLNPWMYDRLLYGIRLSMRTNRTLTNWSRMSPVRRCLATLAGAVGWQKFLFSAVAYGGIVQFVKPSCSGAQSRILIVSGLWAAATCRHQLELLRQLLASELL